MTIVVPTRNEAANVGPLVDRLAAAFAGGPTWEVLFVDDSDDDTPAAVKETARRAPVRLLHRPRGQRAGGLGGAVQEGFVAASGTVVAVWTPTCSTPLSCCPAW